MKRHNGQDAWQGKNLCRGKHSEKMRRELTGFCRQRGQVGWAGLGEDGPAALWGVLKQDHRWKSWQQLMAGCRICLDLGSSRTELGKDGPAELPRC